MVRLPSRMFLLNSCPMTRQLLVDLGDPGAGRVVAVDAGAAEVRQRLVEQPGGLRVELGGVQRGEDLVQLAVELQVRAELLHVLDRGLSARAHRLVGVHLAEQRPARRGVGHADHALVPDPQRLLGGGRLAGLEPGRGVTGVLEAGRAALVEPGGETVGGGQGHGSWGLVMSLGHVRILSHGAKPDQRVIEVSANSSTVACVPDPAIAQDVMIAARGLRKSFGDFEAVRGIDLDVRRGEAFGFLGPNGAGKSSTMRMIAAVSPVSGGELRIFGRDPATDGPAIRGRLGVCPQDDTLDNELNVFDNLFIYGRYFGIPAAEVRERAEELLEFVQLTEKAKSKVEDLSGGMKRRLTIARSLVNKPDLLLLDEPTTGLDPQARHLLWDKLFRLKQTGVTLVITTHYMDEAEQLCDRLVVMDKGVIVAEGSPAALIQQHSTREVTELRFGLAGEDDTHDALAEKVADLGDRVEVLPDRLLVYSDDGDEVAAKVHERGLQPVAVLVRRSTLEDVFLHLTGRTLVD